MASSLVRLPLKRVVEELVVAVVGAVVDCCEKTVIAG